MSPILDPILSEFDTQEQAASYDRWFRAQVQEALDSQQPRIPHDMAMSRVQSMLDERRKARAGNSVG